MRYEDEAPMRRAISEIVAFEPAQLGVLREVLDALEVGRRCDGFARIHRMCDHQKPRCRGE